VVGGAVSTLCLLAGVALSCGAGEQVPREPRSLEQAAALAPRLLVPYRVQRGPTCGLYAVGMVMDHYALLDAANPTAHVFAGDAARPGAATLAPTDARPMMDVARQAGYLTEGLEESGLEGGLDERTVARLAERYGYATRLHPPTAEALREILARGRPALVALDVDSLGRPTLAGWKRGHWAVIVGSFRFGGHDWFLAQHGHRAGEYVWKGSELEASMRQRYRDATMSILEVSPGERKP
jgi:hypothetical protein